MTNEDWAKVEEILTHEWIQVGLLCDGYRLTLQLSRIKPMQLGITFFVNGWLRGKWILNDCEERMRFFRPLKRPVHSARYRSTYMKLSKETRDHLGWDMSQTVIYWQPWWPSFRALKAHLIKYNKSIELVPMTTAEMQGAYEL